MMVLAIGTPVRADSTIRTSFITKFKYQSPRCPALDPCYDLAKRRGSDKYVAGPYEVSLDGKKGKIVQNTPAWQVAEVDVPGGLSGVHRLKAVGLRASTTIGDNTKTWLVDEMQIDVSGKPETVVTLNVSGFGQKRGDSKVKFYMDNRGTKSTNWPDGDLLWSDPN